MIALLFELLILVIVAAVLWWIISLVPLPEPFPRIVQVIVAVILLVWLIYLLLPFTGQHPFHP